MSGAGGALLDAARVALKAVGGLSGSFEPGPVQAGDGHAIVEIGPESDWSHKSGAGRELRLAVTIRGSGEASARVRSLADQAEAELAEIGGEAAGWRIVGMRFLRSRMLREGKRGWSAVIEFQARMLRL